MKEERSFYIGWQDNMPASQKSFLKKVLIPVFIFIPILAFLIVWIQNPFNNHIFEFGSITEHTGIYHARPVPILEVNSNTLPEGISNYVLLVGYAKYGAEGIISEIEKEFGSFNNKKVTIQGSLIYGDGKAILELTKQEESLVKLFDESITSSDIPGSSTKFEKTGEILDPKCYFGVMKPGEGKIHKSCAIRCISGGIPPVFRVKQDDDVTQYYVLLGPKGEKINKEILHMVGEDVVVNGIATSLNGWDVLHIDPNNIQ